MVTMKFSATKSETLFLTPTIAVEQDNSETAIRFALWHSVFSVEVSKSYKTVKAKEYGKKRNVCNSLYA